MSKRVKQVGLAEQLRAAIAAAGLSRYELSKRTGVSYSTVHGFAAGTHDITLSTASRLCDAVGAELRWDSGKARKGR